MRYDESERKESVVTARRASSLERPDTGDREREYSIAFREKQKLEEEVERLKTQGERMAVDNEKLKNALERAKEKKKDGDVY